MPGLKRQSFFHLNSNLLVRTYFSSPEPSLGPLRRPETGPHHSRTEALEIETQAKRLLADEYDAAQERGEVVGPHNGARNRVPQENAIATVSDLGLTRKAIHEARQLRDAEAADPGVIPDPMASAAKPHLAAAAFFGLRALAGFAAGSAGFFRPRAFGASATVSAVVAAFAAAFRC